MTSTAELIVKSWMELNFVVAYNFLLSHVRRGKLGYNSNNLRQASEGSCSGSGTTIQNSNS